MTFLKSPVGKALTGFGVLAVLLLVWFLLAPAALTAKLVGEVAARTGRTLTVDGGSSLSLLPEPAIVLHDAKLGSAPGMDGAVISARAARLPVSLGGLFTRHIRLEEINLDGAVLALTVDGKGRTSFANSEASAAPAETPGNTGPRPQHKPLHVTFSDGTVTFNDARNGNRFAASDAAGTLDFNPAGELNAQGTASVDHEATAFTVFLADLSRLADDGSPFDLTLTGAGGAFTYTGRLSTRDTLNLAGQASLESADLRRTLKWLGLPVSGAAGLRNFTARGAVSSEGSLFTFKDVDLAMDGMAARGAARVDFAGARPMLRATLATESLDLSAYVLAADDAAPATGKGDAQPVAPWSEKFFDASGLMALDAELTVGARRLVMGQLAMGPADLTARLAAGKLVAEFKVAGLEGGGGTVTAGLDASAPLPHLSLNLALADVEAQGFLGKLLDFHWLSGPMAVSAELQADGNSQARLISTLSGSADLALASGAVRGVDLNRLVRAVAATATDGWGADPALGTALENASAHFTVRDGIATSSDITLSAAGLSVAAAGDVDILRRAVDLVARPQLAAAGDGTALPVQVKVSGPWDGPRVTADAAGVLQDLGVNKHDAKKAVKAGKKLLKSLTGN